jgi:tetratricopeptide (TPR) repeat protein
MHVPRPVRPAAGQEVNPMVKARVRILALLVSSLFVMACGVGKQADIEVQLRVTMDGKPAPQAKVLLDGVEAGRTDKDGNFSQTIKRLPGAEVQVVVQKEAPGYRVEPWKQSFLVKLPKGDSVEIYTLTADLKVTKAFTVTVADGGQPVKDASVLIDGEVGGKTGDDGEYVHQFQVLSTKGFDIKVSKKGYSTWQKRLKVEPGEIVEVSLSKESGGREAVEEEAVASGQKKETAEPEAPAMKRKGKGATISFATATESYGVSGAIPNVVVEINGKQVGKTNQRGVCTYRYEGTSGVVAKVKLVASGYIPPERQLSVKLEGKQNIRQLFYPAQPKPLKVAIYGYVNNSPQEDLSEVISTVEKGIGDNLFIYKSFVEVPKEKLRKSMLNAKLDLQTLATRGWQATPLLQTADVIISGSVSRDGQGFAIESTVNAANGQTILSQLNKVNKRKDLDGTVKLIVNNIIDQFPFEGTVDAADEARFRVNLGKLDYRIRRGNEFKYLAADIDKNGSVKGYHEAGMLVVKDNEDKSSWTTVLAMNPGEQIKVGDKVVRRIYLEGEKDAARSSCILAVKGGTPPNATPLWGVNIYVDNTWVGSTDAEGKAEVPVRLQVEHELLLSKYGYEQAREKLTVTASKEAKEYVLKVADALFRVESEPSGAEIFVDDLPAGKTPLTEGRLVNFGFHRVKLSAGGEYRDWEQVLEFNKSEVDRTGPNKVVLVKDFLKIGRMAEQNGNIDAAIQAYASTEKGHPDYSEAHHRLAQLYMDQKNDYDSAIREFENVLSLPENRQIIYKQFAVTYTNLGHAYYEKGNQFIQQDKQAAAENFTKAIQALKIAKQNTRFFPTRQYGEAVHDTYYYQALAYHKLYLVTQQKALLDKADLAWKEYFDFFPKELEGRSDFAKMRQSAMKYWAQIKDLK